MNALRTIWLKLRSLGQRRAVKQEIDEELCFHIEQRTAESTAAIMSFYNPLLGEELNRVMASRQ